MNELGAMGQIVHVIPTTQNQLNSRACTVLYVHDGILISLENGNEIIRVGLGLGEGIKQHFGRAARHGGPEFPGLAEVVFFSLRLQWVEVRICLGCRGCLVL